MTGHDSHSANGRAVRAARFGLTMGVLLLLLLGCVAEAPRSVLEQTDRFGEPVELPPVDLDDTSPLLAALHTRRSTREFSPAALPTEVIGRLFWAAQGITDAAGHRTAPSAGAHYPLEVYAVSAPEIVHYLPVGHRTESRLDSAAHAALADVAFGQTFISNAPTVIVITAVAGRTEAEYGAVAADLVNREAGHAAQNVLLQATALDLAAVPIGGFDPARLARLLALPPGEEPLYLIPVGSRER